MWHLSSGGQTLQCVCVRVFLSLQAHYQPNDLQCLQFFASGTSASARLHVSPYVSVLPVWLSVHVQIWVMRLAAQEIQFVV